MTLTSESIEAILGPVDEALVSDILATGADASELAEAWAWINSEEALVSAGKSFPSGRVAALIEILSADDGEDE